MNRSSTGNTGEPGVPENNIQERLLILLVEDDPGLAAALAQFLRSQDFEVITVGDGQRGVELATSVNPSLILCDLDLPKMDGFEVLTTLQTNPSLWDTPFLFITGRGHLKDIRAGMNLGADDYLVKPVPPEDLLTAIQTRLRLRNQRASQRPGLTVDNPPTGDGEEDESPNIESGLIFLRSSKGKQRVAIQDIEWIAAYGEYSRVVWGGTEGVLIRKSLKSWESELPTESFLRVHRNTIINLRRLERVEKGASAEMLAFLIGRPVPIEVSLRKVAVLNRRLKHPIS